MHTLKMVVDDVVEGREVYAGTILKVPLFTDDERLAMTNMVIGAVYLNTTTGRMNFWNGINWRVLNCAVIN